MSTILQRMGQIAVFGLAGGLTYAAWKRWSAAQFNFADQVVVITGGSRGLGLEMARLWCAEGAKVAFCSRTSSEVHAAEQELTASGGTALGAVCDVTIPTDVESFIRQVTERWGAIDVLVNNAGIIQVGPQECMTKDDYEQALATHFWGPFNMVEAILPGMKARRRGRIVNISSIGGRIGVPHLVPYAMSKFALAGWSEGLTAELRQHGIFVTTVTPGLMRTGSARQALFKGRHRAEYAWFSIGAGLPLLAIDSTSAARRIVEACRRGAPTAMVSGFSAVASRLHGLCPGSVTELLAWTNSLLPGAQGGTRQNRKGWESESAWSPSLLTTLNDQAAVRNREI